MYIIIALCYSNNLDNFLQIGKRFILKQNADIRCLLYIKCLLHIFGWFLKGQPQDIH